MRKLLVMLAALASPAAAAPPDGFDARVESLRQQTGVPGMSVVIVEDGQVTLARGYGVRKLGEPDKVDAGTIFPTGSTGKAVTVAALATLVDAGRISWDDKVTDRLPGFQMYDPWVTREMTVRDLLSHRSGLGLGEGDLLFVPRGGLSRAESVRRLRFLKPATSFRSAYAYDNVLYMVAGQLIEAVTGQSWEDYVREHVMVPAGMLASTSDEGRRFATADRAYPHARSAGAVRGDGEQQTLDERDELGRNAAPAGGLAVSADDMGKWLALQLAEGALPGGGRLFSKAAHDEMWAPAVLEPVAPEPESLKLRQPMFRTYALGWDVQDYRGAKLVWHGGAVLGFKTAVALLPDKHVGFAIEINSEDGQLVLGLMHELLDHYLGLPFNDWPAKFQAAAAARTAGAAASVAAGAPAQPSPLPLSLYTGTYVDPWYGEVVVAGDDKGLTIDFRSTPRMSGALEHLRYGTFVTRFDDRTIEPALVTFDLDSDGRVSRVTMKPRSPIADFSYDYQDLDLRPAPAR